VLFILNCVAEGLKFLSKCSHWFSRLVNLGTRSRTAPRKQDTLSVIDNIRKECMSRTEQTNEVVFVPANELSRILG
jgi:hypothetical protein